MRTYSIILITLFLSLLLLSGCISQQKVQLENTDKDWDSTQDYKWSNNGEIRYGVDYNQTSSGILVFLRGTSNSSNQEIVIDDYYLENKTLKIKTSLKDKPELGTRAKYHPDKVVRVYVNNEMTKIEHIFADHGSVSVDVKNINTR